MPAYVFGAQEKPDPETGYMRAIAFFYTLVTLKYFREIFVIHANTLVFYTYLCAVTVLSQAY